MPGTIQKIKIDSLINYFENPRHIVGNSEQDTLMKLFDAVGVQYMLNLAEDIQKHGLLGNQQIVVVYSEDIKKYVVYEGNRRVAAIKLLMNPDCFVFLDKASVDKVKKIAKDIGVIDTLNCYVTDEEEAFFIMERTHSGEDKGRGVKSWTPREKEIFKVRQSSVKNLSYLIDFYVKKYCNGLDITVILPFTTIQRIFNNREVRKQIGLEVANEDTFTAERMKLVVDASNWVVKESASAGVSVTRLFNKSRTIEDKLVPWIQEYMRDTAKHSTESQEHDDTNNGSAQENAGANNAQDNSTQNTSKGNNESNSTNNTSSRTGRDLPYFFQGLNYHSLDPNDADTHGVKAVCKELQMFSDKKMVAIYPLASTFLIRAIIEQSIKYYSKKHKIQAQNKYIWDDIKDLDKLSKIIDKYKKNLPNYIVNKEIRQYFISLFGDYEKTVDPLNWVIHRPSEFRLDASSLIELPQKGLLTLINYMLS